MCDCDASGEMTTAWKEIGRCRPLLAVLLNPAGATSGMRTLGAVRRAAHVLGYQGYEVANLFTEATATVVDLNVEVISKLTWSERRERISMQIHSAGGVLAAWGVAGASGTLRRERDARAAWVVSEAARLGHDQMWMVGGEPRHPSRWHQYVADKNRHCTSGTFEERLGQVLVPVSLKEDERVPGVLGRLKTRAPVPQVG